MLFSHFSNLSHRSIYFSPKKIIIDPPSLLGRFQLDLFSVKVSCVHRGLSNFAIFGILQSLSHLHFRLCFFLPF
jgi:hypothetical protein